MNAQSWYSSKINSILIHPLYLDYFTKSSRDVSCEVLGSSINRELSNVIVSGSRRLDKPYETKLKCITDQHDECSCIMLDYLGLWAAYKSYLNNTESSNDDNRKKFWTSLARSYCANEVQSECSGLTSYSRRIKLSLRNYNEFSNDFECNSDTFMNSKYKCSAWVKH